MLPVLDSPTINSRRLPRPSYNTTTTSPHSPLMTSSCKPLSSPWSPPGYTADEGGSIPDSLPTDYYNRSNYALVCRYPISGSSSFPVVAMPIVSDGVNGGRSTYAVDSSTIMDVAGRVVMPSAPGLDDDDSGEGIVSAMVSAANETVGRDMAAVIQWPPIGGPCCTHVIHPPPIYTRYATPPTGTDSGANKSYPTTPSQGSSANSVKEADFV